MILRSSERSLVRNRFFASCWVSVEPPCTDAAGAGILVHGAGKAEEIDAEIAGRNAVFGRQHRLDQMIRQLVDRHGVFMD